jgi:hypothetical protein
MTAKTGEPAQRTGDVHCTSCGGKVHPHREPGNTS